MALPLGMSLKAGPSYHIKNPKPDSEKKKVILMNHIFMEKKVNLSTLKFGCFFPPYNFPCLPFLVTGE